MPETERLDATNPAHITRAAYLLRTGHTVAFPTETVYGLGANALDPDAVAKIFTAKQRPAWDPLIVHLATRAQLAEIAWTNSAAENLMDKFWPGPLTLLLPRTPAIPDAVTAGRPLVGVRIPAHPVALALLAEAGIPIAAPSANTFSHTSPTTAQHVLADLDGRIDAVLDGGATQVGLESTVAEVVDERWRNRCRAIIYRPGAITEEMLSSVASLGLARQYRPSGDAGHDLHSLPSPGVGIRHYAPRARMVLVEDNFARTRQKTETWLTSAIDEAQTHNDAVGAMLPTGWDKSSAKLVFSWGPWEQPEVLAARLYTGLRELDDRGATVIVCPVPPTNGIGQAIADRLKKAAEGA